MNLSKELQNLKENFWDADTQAKFIRTFPNSGLSCGNDTDLMFVQLVELCAYNVDEYCTLEDSVCGFLCE